jgi:hypothetical protein
MRLHLDSGNMEGISGGSFSVSVIDEKSAVPVARATSIKSDFALGEPTREMLAEFTYPVERGITLEGICKNKKGKGKKTMLTIIPENLETIYLVPTRANGEFTMKNLIFYDSAKFGIQPAEEKVTFKNREGPPLPEKLPEIKLHLMKLDSAYTASTGDTLQTTMLKEVKLTEKRTRQYENSYAEPDVYIKSESIETYQNVAAAIAAKVPEYRLFLYEGHWYLTWRRGEFTRMGGAPAEPAVYIDQALVVGETAGDRLYLLNPAMIDHIEVNGMISSNLGANGANGLISVFTKRVADAPFKGLPVLKARGFDRAVEFHSPDYDRQPQVDKDKIDFRSTLYWNPLVGVLSTQSTVDLSFFTSDQPGDYRVIIEGVTNAGSTVHQEDVIKVKEE